MFRKSTVALIATLAILSFVLAACQPAVTPTPVVQVQTVVVEKEGKTIIITTTPAPTTPPPAQPGSSRGEENDHNRDSEPVTSHPLIPSHAQSVDEVQVILANTVGLVRQNSETAEIEKG